MMNKVKSPISWVGGKFYLAKKITALFPKHTLYVEVFGGAAHVLFRKSPSECEIYNDINRNLVCFFTTVKDRAKCDILYDKLSAVPYSRYVFNQCLLNLKRNDISDIDRAFCFIVVNKQSFASLMETWGNETGSSSRQVSMPFYSTIDKLHQACERLKNVQLECMDFRYVLKRYDRPDTLFYLDPPYSWDKRSKRIMYDNELSAEDHEELAVMLLNLKGKAVLSGYNTPIYDRLAEAGWYKISLGSMAINMNKRVGEKRLHKEEFVWCNFPQNELTQGAE